MTRLLVGQGLLAVLGGLGCGLVAAWWLTRALEANAVFRQFTAQLFHITAHDPWTLVGVSGVILLVGAGACLFPARRASRLQPAIVLRNE